MARRAEQQQQRICDFQCPCWVRLLPVGQEEARAQQQQQRHAIGMLILATGSGLMVGLMLGLMTRIEQLQWALRVLS